jgi:hypothetical protein
MSEWTIEALRGIGACDHDCARLQKVFGPAAPVNLENVKKVALDIDWWGGARRIFSVEQYRKFRVFYLARCKGEKTVEERKEIAAEAFLLALTEGW